MYISMLYNPLRQIADKFNVMQMGIVAADRVFEILESDAEVQNDGTIHSDKLHGNIKLEDVRFSYLKKEEVLECPLLMPDIEEQIQIVKLIDTATEELNQYQQKLEALQLQKRGLMQQLLTGKTRVKI